ncbi:hypothetical protein SF1_18830 [Sphingobacterium faecium NBRC 15299]|uniref:hypothetical protein n=1 Tax=Sphingobacterium faecium TaxID=34087 RepID=UPI000D3B189E|nr:hypothetical protein [Sphingobacterium faecium]PTX09477.1 hypothetical protein C8N37_106105 [Sphingobacterium faecium]GEM63901.1 hypothetical protein SF1_18830 [Sphingobacterium faecium NBRC 15299]
MDNYITYTELMLITGGLLILYIILKFIRGHWFEFMEMLNQEVEVYELDLLADQHAAVAKDGNFLKALEKLINDLRFNILVKAGKTATKEQLMEAFSEKVANYDGLHHPAFRYALNNYIIQYTEKICGVKIEEEELENLWNDLPRKTKTL